MYSNNELYELNLKKVSSQRLRLKELEVSHSKRTPSLDLSRNISFPRLALKTLRVLRESLGKEYFYFNRERVLSYFYREKALYQAKEYFYKGKVSSQTTENLFKKKSKILKKILKPNRFTFTLL